MEVLCGADENFLSAVIAGSNAAIMASANVIPHIWLDIMKKVKKGKIEEAAELQRTTQTFARMVLKFGAAPPVKAALRMLGVKAGRSRMPLNTGGTLSSENKEEIRIELEKMGLIDNIPHSPVQKDIQIIDLLAEQGITIGEVSELKTSNASNDVVSVSAAVGSKSGPLGEAFVRLLTTPKTGHEALTVILEPNLAVKPSSLMLPTRKIETMRQASFFYGPVQSGAAKAFASMLEQGKIPTDSVNNDVTILALDIDLNLRDRREITSATHEAVETALGGIWR
jgi:5,6,7,8-tetrahydromethanopterin hydro-lyase